MRLFVTPEFVDAVERLPEAMKVTAQRLYLLLVDSSHEHLAATGKLHRLASRAGSTETFYVLRQGNLRVFCSIDSDKDGTYLLLLGISQKQSGAPFKAPVDAN